jgi:Xaa-Pro aminopeptidase
MIADVLRQHGLHGEPLGVDVVELPVLRAPEDEGLQVVDAQALMMGARQIKTMEEIALLDQPAALVAAAYEQLVVEKDGAWVITRFPADELLVAGGRY